MSLSSLFGQISQRRALVIGDFFLDTYTIGTTNRISPEAPVAVVRVTRQDHKPGGAGNVALNLISLGMSVSAVGRIGSDETGRTVSEALKSEGIAVDLFTVQKQYDTPVKNRIISSNQQMVRVDYEEVTHFPEHLEEDLIQKLPKAMEGVDVIAVSDYGKGFLTDTLLGAIMRLAKERSIPVITDPKGTDFSKYAGTTIIKPNFSEAVQASGLDSGADLAAVAEKCLRYSHAEELVITRSEKGMARFNRKGAVGEFPVKVREVKDVTGAGDTVLAVLAFAVANRIDLSEGCKLANVAAGIAVEHIGCARISLGELADRLLAEDLENKVFGDDHLYALQEVLKGRDLTVLGLSEKTEISAHLFEAIHSLTERGHELLVYIRDANPNPILIRLLTSHSDVHYLIHHGESFRKFCGMVHPTEVYVFRGGSLQKIEEVATLAT